jgi:cytidylate kinase
VTRAAVIAIDGPAGAGKSTAARLVAERLGFVLIDTGALYRAVALVASERGVRWDDGPALGALAGMLELRFGRVAEGRPPLFIDGADRSADIRRDDISQGASRVSAYPEVRAALLGVQRAMGAEGGVVLEGRDIGTVVFPDADVKIYLDASPEERARRRANDPAHTGGQAGQAAVAASIEARDKSDTTRTASPLTLAPDATLIDTTGMPIDEVVSRVMGLLDGKIRG